MGLNHDLISLAFASAGLNFFVLGLIANPKSQQHRLLMLATVTSHYLLSFYWVTPTYALFTYLHGVQLFFSFLRLTDFLYLNGGDRKLQGQEQPTPSLSFLDRIKWGVKYSISIRWIGWEMESKAALLPRRTWNSRQKFLFYQFIWAITYGIMLDIALLPITFRPSVSGDPTKTASYPLIWRYMIIGVTPPIACLGLQITYSICSILLVLFDLSNPNEWPPLFGPLKESYTIRRLWGRTWHQFFRVDGTKALLNHAQYFTDGFLKLKNRKLKNLVQLFTVFFLSGLIHEAGDYAVHRRWNGSSMCYFLVQAAGIALEDLLGIPRAIGGKEASSQKRWVGYIWTYGWSFLTAPLFVDPALFFVVREGTSYFSPILGISKGEWFPDLGVLRQGSIR
ncbi:hypothetical protein M422DRAFT_68273 [Sphaerobolus stellatus SS14]|uniref:Wax synthase domain-containing protein n=1 Tax=Sphaerobolus stellatus (strain SS14) TaxID=990650 RepID=A0A0C9VIB3_SPHS4|nr:hypothetical protein M422DRAFT_68273 [Sphaerobolus stellatus SS14]